ncbi:serotonin N-acetyltransferase-like [Lingula anatina]|uniref:Serotonin N-acetyltransferase n=1 Tax=Lingula anatina TaxID=7574 RepID=A0A1S3K3J4_LINAN|nr:serotonin N-acetyltransferase-like [Lingula anatina]|eukprot:XP_013417195.1 serotonin N-acetyltransferase-like [Lingula anatina]
MPDRMTRVVLPSEIDQAYLLEKASYPHDEAASLEILKYRQDEAPDLFLGHFEEDTLIGYVCASRYHGDELTEESMKVHIPEGASVCIHSVVVWEKRRRQGIALHLLKEFIYRVKETQSGVLRILLICRAKHIPLYTRAGFVLTGPSKVQHGRGTWFAMEMSINGKENEYFQ